jgi:anti-sigma regulatory factor (Ser/Thr protein kinase)
VCGLFGYTSFNAVRYFEDIAVKDETQEKNDAPDVLYILYKVVIVFDHHNNMVKVVTLGDASEVDDILKAMNRSNVREYDFCLSLGGSCAAAMQLRDRGLRLASMPFDWVRGRDNAQYVETVATMLNSSRTELRRCLWDLKSEALEEPTFERAIRRTLQQILDGTDLSISFEISRRSVNDSTAHAILSVIRELVANAIRHGHAKSIIIKGEHDGRRLKVSVIDDGIGFDLSSCFRSDEGHFGLDGIRNRIVRLGGEFTINSSSGHGTTAVIYLTPQKTTSHKAEQT